MIPPTSRGATPAPLPVGAPPRLRDRIAAAPDGVLRVVHRGPHAVYLDLVGWCVGIVDEHAVQVPCALRTTSSHLARVAVDGAEVRGGTLHLDGHPVVIGRLVDATVPRLGRLLSARPAARRLADHPEQAVERLVGAGDGLTPYGDDVLAGWLAVHRAAGVATPAVDAAVRARLHRTTLLSATLLDCAMHGEVIPEFGRYVAALGTPQQEAAADALARIGHSSGRGLLAGARQGLAELAARQESAA